MRSLLPLAAAGGAGMVWHSLPRWVKIPAAIALIALAAIEMNKDFNESWYSSSTFAGAGAEGDSKAIDPTKSEADAAAGKPVSGAARMMAKQVEAAGADALQKQALAQAMTESEFDLKFKKIIGHPLTTTESLKLAEMKKLKAEAETAEAQATAARAEAEANREAAALPSLKLRRR